MKPYLQLYLLFSVMFIAFSCKENNAIPSIGKTEKQIEIKESKTTPQDSYTDKDKTIKPKRHISQYVNAKSGLNYRDEPNGKILGKFPLNTILTIIDSTKIVDQIADEEKIIKGEWLGVEKGTDTVYVFSSFLSDFYRYSDIKLFYARPYYESNDETRQGFINLSELYPFDYDNDSNTIIPEEKLGEEPIEFSRNESNKILEKMGVSKNDSLYIFSFIKDTVYKFKLDDLKMIAFLNPYTRGVNGTKEYEYEIGLNLEDQFAEKGESFAYIGVENPFQTGKIKPLIWNSTANDNFPLKQPKINNRRELDSIAFETYTLSMLHFKYYIQSQIYYRDNRSRVKSHQLVTVDTTTNKIIRTLNYHSSESISIGPVYKSTDEKQKYYYSWTGELFKNKPPIIYGLYGNSFGCTTVDFIYDEEPSINILCDNRH